MTLSPADRDVLATLCPYDLVGVSETDLGDILDSWFAHDHFDDNPVYAFTNESFDR